MNVRAAAFLLAACLLLAAASARATPAQSRLDDRPWRSARPIKIVVVGGSISKYYAGNFGQYLQFGCSQVEVLNKGKVGAGGAELARIFTAEVAGDAALMAGVKKAKAWVLFQGGLNSVGAPQSTAWFLSRLFLSAHTAGFRVMALSLTPWGSDADARFQGWSGLRTVRATEQVVDFVMARLTPVQALGRRANGRTAGWNKGELADIGIDLYHSPLRAGAANGLRPKAALAASFATSPFRSDNAGAPALIAAGQAVPQSFMAAKYRDFDHIHPNGDGHRLIAALVCQQAPAEWACDCDAIRRAGWKGKVVAGEPVKESAPDWWRSSARAGPRVAWSRSTYSAPAARR